MHLGQHLLDAPRLGRRQAAGPDDVLQLVASARRAPRPTLHIAARSAVKARNELVSAVFCDRMVSTSSLTASTRGPAQVGWS